MTTSSPRRQSKYESWSLDQIAKSEFFHQKLHEYGLLEVAYAIEQVQGELLNWDRESLGISEQAWNKVIHRGIKPVCVFAHPRVLQDVPRSVGYYQKLAMVSLKSMSNIGLSVTGYESGQSKHPLSEHKAKAVSYRLNELISRLIEFDDTLDPREFDLWRGMTAGSTAQGSWQNKKGDRTEEVIKGIITRRLQASGLVIEQSSDGKKWRLKNGQTLEYGSEPDLALYDQDHRTLVAIEIKGGIDTAGVLERIGAAIKSLSRARQENANSITVLIITAVSITEQAELELAAHQDDIDHWFAVEDVLTREETRQEIFKLLGI